MRFPYGSILAGDWDSNSPRRQKRKAAVPSYDRAQLLPIAGVGDVSSWVRLQDSGRSIERVATDPISVVSTRNGFS